VQPIMFVLLFRYVFGNAISTPGTSYVNYLMPGIFVQTVAFGAVSTSIGLAEDLQKGLIERFRALPMARSAVLTGRTSADLVRNVFVCMIMTAVGFLVGFRPTTGVVPYVAGILLILLFAYSLSWGFAVIGLSAPNSETAQVMSFPLRPGFIDAQLAAGIRHLPAGERDGHRLPGTHDRRADRLLGHPVGGLDHRIRDRPGAIGRSPLPHPHLSSRTGPLPARQGRPGEAEWDHGPFPCFPRFPRCPRLVRRPRQLGRRRHHLRDLSHQRPGRPL
jgi:hypothetical protein